MAVTPAVPGLDVDLIRDWIDGLGLDAKPPIRIAPIGAGKSNLTFLAEDGVGKRWVLRRPPLGELLPSAHDVAREFRILSALVETAVPAPHPIALRQPDPSLDVPLVLMEHISGLVIDADRAVDSVDLGTRHAIGISLARRLSTIHAVDLAATGLDDLANKKPYAGRQLKRWRRRFEESKTADKPLVDELADLLERKAPVQREVTLVHGDYHLMNVIADPGNGEVLGILDWELSTLGEPIADLGGLLAFWPQADDPGRPVPFPFPSRLGFPGREELVAAYAEACGRDVVDVGYWETLGCWKVAVIGEGILRRRLDQPANGDPAEAAELTDLMLRRAVAAAERAGI